MAYTEKLSDATLNWIAEQIGKHIFSVLDPESYRNSKMQIMETFPLWILRAEAVAEAAKTGQDLPQIAKAAGLWHHQIEIDGYPKACARTKPLGEAPDSWSLQKVFNSLLAKKIDMAIDWIDRNTDGEPLVRLLFVSSYNVHAFWLSEEESNENQVFIIDVPNEYTNLETNRLYASGEFLEKLLDEEHSLGIRIRS
jgi:hypothetical protein